MNKEEVAFTAKNSEISFSIIKVIQSLFALQNNIPDDRKILSRSSDEGLKTKKITQLAAHRCSPDIAVYN